jgi:nucleotide-binding universal stress UspA family protein
MKRILVGLDHSPRAAAVLEQAAMLARATGAELYLLRALSIPAELPPDAFRSSPGELVERWREESARDLERQAGAVDPTIVTHVLVHIGSPWQSICQVAKDHAVDLIVIGSHGLHGIERLLGTTANKVVNHADHPVLVVR